MAKKVIIVVLIVLFFVFAIQLFMYQKKSGTSPLDSLRSLFSKTTPTPTPPQNYNILYQADKVDTTGRSTLYQKKDPELETETDGVAYKFDPFGNRYIFTGIFDHIIPISGSQDFYLYINNPFDLREPTQLARVAVQDTDYASRTNVSVQSLIEKDMKTYLISSDARKNDDLIEKLLKKDDAVTVIFARRGEQDIAVLKADSNNVPYAETVILRRNASSDEIYAEANQ